ncbi:hypothetical protein GWI33_015062 [Rhynchophorus ferrugineus]|uniref:Uncharacterized protein n=1 Tax=Rhynchophorus ferrugineus TaxID=354439 RepID=A0A834I066_RHYFE|nr:hypothetical protein GWI33_015062 [Rhynchophorus ferrugineus]
MLTVGRGKSDTRKRPTPRITLLGTQPARDEPTTRFKIEISPVINQNVTGTRSPPNPVDFFPSYSSLFSSLSPFRRLPSTRNGKYMILACVT